MEQLVLSSKYASPSPQHPNRPAGPYRASTYMLIFIKLINFNLNSGQPDAWRGIKGTIIVHCM